MRKNYKRRKASLLNVIAGLDNANIVDSGIVGEIDELDESIGDDLDLSSLDDEFLLDDGVGDDDGFDDLGIYDVDSEAAAILDEIDDIEGEVEADIALEDAIAARRNRRRNLRSTDDTDELKELILKRYESTDGMNIDNDDDYFGASDGNIDIVSSTRNRRASRRTYELDNTGAGGVPSTSNLYKTKVKQQTIGEHMGLKERNKVARIVKALDEVANELEYTGQAHAALAIDEVSDDLEELF